MEHSMGKQPHLYEDEMLRFFAQLGERAWIKLVQPTSLPFQGLIVTTTDGQVWTINNPLNYARLLYLYERDTK